MQIHSLEKNFEHERKTLGLRKFDLEKKLAGVTQELAVAQSNLAVKNSELHGLQNNLMELEELREMKEVILCSEFCI